MKRQKRGVFSVIGLVLGLTWIGISHAAEKPNVLVVLVDDLGVGDLGCYGAEDLQTPNLDRLVGEGMRFDNAYANCPVCSPTRAALLTGRYQELVGVPGVIRTYPQDNWGNLADDSVMLPALL
ncbi:MAG: sulfatase-like hydrolase/transferase, partial [Verrucomicrobiales bacterium]|nr:sulfatase-like hydrolase/transferase [Verrucomicrobiales bacterium]